jgi:hypothetical protein
VPSATCPPLAMTNVSPWVKLVGKLEVTIGLIVRCMRFCATTSRLGISKEDSRIRSFVLRSSLVFGAGVLIGFARLALFTINGPLDQQVGNFDVELVAETGDRGYHPIRPPWNWLARPEGPLIRISALEAWGTKPLWVSEFAQKWGVCYTGARPQATCWSMGR